MLSNIMDVGASGFTSRPEKSLGFDHEQLSDSFSTKKKCAEYDGENQKFSNS